MSLLICSLTIFYCTALLLQAGLSFNSSKLQGHACLLCREGLPSQQVSECHVSHASCPNFPTSHLIIKGVTLMQQLLMRLVKVGQVLVVLLVCPQELICTGVLGGQ